MGLANGPSHFQRLADNIMDYLMDPDTGRRICQVFLDDVVIHSVTWEQHLASIRAMLTRLCENDPNEDYYHQMYSWGQPSCQFLGYELREGKTLPSPKLVKAIEDFPRPTTVKQVLSYLGTCKKSRNYIPLCTYSSPAIRSDPQAHRQREY